MIVTMHRDLLRPCHHSAAAAAAAVAAAVGTDASLGHYFSVCPYCIPPVLLAQTASACRPMQCSTEAATVVPGRWRPKVRWRPVSGTPESVTVDVGVYSLQHFASCITFSGHDRLHKCWLNWDVAPLHHMQGATTILRCYQQFARLACNKMVLCSAVP